MARSYCQRCDEEKPESKGGFCPYCLTHTNTYYADNPRSEMVSYESFRIIIPDRRNSVVKKPIKQCKKERIYSKEKLEKEQKVKQKVDDNSARENKTKERKYPEWVDIRGKPEALAAFRKQILENSKE